MRKSLWLRGAALLMAVVLLGTAAAGCKKDDGQGDGEEKEYTVYPGEEPVDLNGYEFTVIDFWDGHWNREKTGTPYADTWMQVLDEVEGLYNCKITPTYISAGEIFDNVQPEVAAGEKGYDLICTTQWGIGYFIGGGYLMDLNTLDIDWNQPYWNQNIRQDTTVAGKTYAGGGPFIFDTQSTWMVQYNEAIWNELRLPDPYELVKSGQWTLDRMADYAIMAAKDQDGNGVVDTIDDRWGFVCAEGDWIRASILGMGSHYFTTDENGHVVVGCNNTHTFDIIEKMRRLMSLGGCYLYNPQMDETQRVSVFVNGNSLFYAYMPGKAELKEMEDDWGVMPLPKYDEAQEGYFSGIDQNAFVFGCTSTNTNTKELSTLMTALGLHAQILEEIYWPDYKETYWRHEEQDTEIMRDYVVGHGLYDIALLMRNCVNVFWAPVTQIEKNIMNRGGDFASYIESVEDAIQAHIDEYFQY